MSNTVIKSPVVYGKSNNVIVAFDSKSAMSIHINGVKIPLVLAKGKSNDFSNFINDNKSIGIYVYGSNQLNIHSVSALSSQTFLMHNLLEPSTMSSILSNGYVSDTQPFTFSLDPIVLGMQMYDVQLEPGPSFNHQIVAPEGGYEIKSGDTTTKLFVVTDKNSIISPIHGGAYNAQFGIINKAEAFLPLNGSLGQFTPLMIKANTLVKTDESLFSKKLSNSIHSNNPIEIASDWIQTESNAELIANKIIRGIKTSSDKYSIEVFGNPLIELGDTVKLKYYEGNIIKDDTSFIVIGKENSYDNGFSTTIKLRELSR
jgi:hypothetical protein